MKHLTLCLLALLVMLSGASAAPLLLYQTGWESSPASPGWATGNVAPQNGWTNYSNPAGHVVVANGSAAAVIGGQQVTTPHGNQFHRFNGNESTAQGGFLRLAWPDVTAAFAGRPSGFDLVTASMDVFIPSTQAADDSVYGLVGYNDTDPAFGVFVEPASRGVVLLVADIFVALKPGIIPYNTWTNVSVTADYGTGRIFASLGGTPIESLTDTNAFIPFGSLTYVDLAVQHSPTAPVPRSIFSDNYRVIADEVRPGLAIERGNPGFWTLSWDATFVNWILESTANIAAGTWRTENVTPSIQEGVASVTRPGEQLRFYRLRKP